MTGVKLDAVRALSRRFGHGEVDAVEDADGEKIAVEAFHRRTRRRRNVVVAAGAVAIAASIAFVVATRRPAALPSAFDVEGAASVDRGYVVASDTVPASLKFADGSVVRLAPRARVRVVREPGIVVMLEDGVVAVERARSSGVLLAFRLDAGPCSIEPAHESTVNVSWMSSASRAELDVARGSAAVVGGAIRERLVVRAGQHAVVDVAGDRFSVDAAIDTASAPSPAVTPDTTASAARAPATASAPRGIVAPATWSHRVARGEFAPVVADAESRGIDNVLARQPLADLVALADAARFSARRDLARRAFLAQRERFPGSPEARAAAFHLGRLADDSSGPASAVPFYDRYLVEAPDGPFAAEALGRKMVALSRAGRTNDARSAAREYESRYPNGAHAAVARELTRN